MTGMTRVRLTIAFAACVAFRCASAPPASPSRGGCAVDVWMISWNSDLDAGFNDEDEMIKEAQVHEHLETCSYAEAIRSWLDRAPETSVKKPEKGDEFLTDFRVVARVTSNHGSDLVGVNGDCAWVRRNRKQFLAYDPSLFEILKQPLSAATRSELDTYLSHPACGPKATPH